VKCLAFVARGLDRAIVGEPLSLSVPCVAIRDGPSRGDKGPRAAQYVSDGRQHQ